MRLLETIWLLPRNGFLLFILGWRKAISPLYGDVCRFYPTCSSYGLQQVQQRGLVMGSVLTTWRILRCNPFNSGGIDDVTPGSQRFLVNPKGLVVSKRQKGQAVYESSK
jgi:putative membrane protein insertion efficiency factor